MDRTVRQLSAHVAKKVTDRLETLFNTDKEAFTRAWPDIETIIKLGCLQDDKFYEKAKSFLLFQNTEGTWSTAEEYKARHPDSPVFYAHEEGLDSHALALYKEKGIEVLKTMSLIDSPLMNFLESKIEDLKFQRVDGALNPTLLDETREKTLLDAEGKTEGSKISDCVRSHLSFDNLKVEAKSLASDQIPAILLTDETSRRMQETLTLTQGALPEAFQAKKTFVVNTNHPLIQKLYGLQNQNPTLAKELSHYLYELSLLSQKELKESELSSFVARSHRVLNALVSGG
jgi:molecular chaperone HtpG